MAAVARSAKEAASPARLEAHIPFATRREGAFVTAMPTTAELVKLPVAERLALIDELLSSIPEAEVIAAPAQVEEAQNRLRELRAIRLSA